MNHSKINPKADDSANGFLRDFPRHMQHASAIGEAHSRPIPNLATNTVIFHYAFISEGGSAVSHSVMSELCRLRGESPPAKGTRFKKIRWGDGNLRWESHSEFSTFTYDGRAPRGFLGEVKSHPFGTGFSPPGTMISACRIEIRKLTPATLKLIGKFDRDSLCVSRIGTGKSLLATDFHQNTNGMTVFLLLEAGMPENRIGYYAKSAIELDTYRTLATLGLPLARTLSSKLSRFEIELSRLTQAMQNVETHESEQLLDEINTLASELEADAASSLFRFGASRAYGNIVRERIRAIGQEYLSGYMAIGSYLERSLGPALLTCESVEERQANLSRKLSRAANLLRTRVEIEIENQNRNLLASMDKRTRMQFRLQQTVEGLSVAAVSYYIVGLFYYFIQAIEEQMYLGISPKVATGMFVPVAVLGIWMFVRRIRNRHKD